MFSNALIRLGVHVANDGNHTHMHESNQGTGGGTQAAAGLSMTLLPPVLAFWTLVLL